MRQLTKHLVRTIAVPALIALCVAATPDAATAQDAYPSGPVKWIIPFPPGGAIDVLARMVAREVEKSLGQPIVIDNRSGGNTFIAMSGLRNAKPDGYTMMITSNDLTIAPNLYKAPLDVEKDIDCVAQIGLGRPFLLVARTDFPAENARDAVQYMKSNPGKVTFASYGNGSISHLGMELFAGTHKIKMTHVPYKGAAPALQDIMARQIDVMADSPVNSLPLAASGKIKVLAVMGKERFPELPNVMTLAEAGAASPADELTSFLALIANKGTPAAAVDKMGKAIETALQQKELRDTLFSRTLIPQYMGGRQFCEKVAQESRAMKKVISDNGIQGNN
jgi:tripartite-type tricarboxylate transporter receptor subunit TctC